MKDLNHIVRLIKNGDLVPEDYSVIMTYLDKNKDYIKDLDDRLDNPPCIFPSFEAALEMSQRLTADRSYVSNIANYFSGLYVQAKMHFLPDKSCDSGRLSEKQRECVQDAKCAPFLYVKDMWRDRISAIDRLCVTLNKVLERENLCMRREA